MAIQIRRPRPLTDLPSAVLFDTDNTLYPYEPAHVAAMDATRSKAARVLGISAQQFDDTFREARHQVKTRLGKTASSHSRLLYFQRMLELIGLRTQVLMALDLEQTYWRVFLSHATLFDNVKDFLDDLRIAGTSTAIITDLTVQIQFRKIVYFGLDQYFDHVVTSEEAGVDKPKEEPFKLALEKLGPITGSIWMIGDDPVCDIQGARDVVGAITFQKKHEGVRILDGDLGPDIVFEDYKELQVLLKGLSDLNGTPSARVEKSWPLGLPALRAAVESVPASLEKLLR
ncbi:hydrolase [Skermanella stibiiresistens SB22]|uniref:Hydrolase n=1 Tax=Skermanella stibiiresistens SB22 TaxID=1385369 RepID=W9H6Z7_9PROT|nr:HAD-IA family hydrolase [Skermanella stibiiresistens]EWY40472.1 hydrolase [Skermanella stibiiresistens SB22]